MAGALGGAGPDEIGQRLAALHAELQSQSEEIESLRVRVHDLGVIDDMVARVSGERRRHLHSVT
jgi:hypothetical protein